MSSPKKTDDERAAHFPRTAGSTPASEGADAEPTAARVPIVGASTDKNEALQLLQGLEGGDMSTAQAQILAVDLDPVLVYFIVRFLRETYPASDPAATPVLERVVQLTSAYPRIVEKSKEGELDPVSQWFAGDYTFGDFTGRGRELVGMIVDKLNT